MVEFDWPCELRIAHGPHAGCGGVKAHPSTMIGRVVASEVLKPRQPKWHWPREITQTIPPRYRSKAKVGLEVVLTHYDKECSYTIAELKTDNRAKFIRAE